MTHAASKDINDQIIRTQQAYTGRRTMIVLFGYFFCYTKIRKRAFKEKYIAK